MKHLALKLICILIVILIIDAPVTYTTHAQPDQLCSAVDNSIIDVIKLSPDGKYLLANYNEYSFITTARLWDLASGKLLHIFVDNTNKTVDSADFSPDGKYIVTSSDNQAVVWDTQTGQKLRTFVHNKIAAGWYLVLEMQARFAPDNDHILTASHGDISLWDINTGDKLHTYLAYLDDLHSRTGDWLSSDRKYMVIRDKDLAGEQFWDLQTGKQVHFFDWAFDAGFTSDNKSIIVAGDSLVIENIDTLTETFKVTAQPHK